MNEFFLKYFFEPGSAVRLGVSRALFYAICLTQYFYLQPADYVQLPHELWTPPFVLWFFSPPDPTVFWYACLALQVVLVLSTLGIFTRVSVLLAAPLMTYVFGVVCSYKWISFHYSPLILIAWVLAFSYCGDAFSLDARWRGEGVEADGEYTWPLRAAWLVLVTLMFTGGYHKLLGGWLWRPAETMEWIFLFKYYPQAAQKSLVLPGLVLTLTRWTWVLGFFGLATLFLEFAAPLALVHTWPKLQIILIGGLFFMQLSLAIMGTLASFPWLGAYAFWVPWDKLIRQ